jgi:hypothetical protein
VQGTNGTRKIKKLLSRPFQFISIIVTCIPSPQNEKPHEIPIPASSLPASIIGHARTAGG